MAVAEQNNKKQKDIENWFSEDSEAAHSCFVVCNKGVLEKSNLSIVFLEYNKSPPPCNKICHE